MHAPLGRTGSRVVKHGGFARFGRCRPLPSLEAGGQKGHRRPRRGSDDPHDLIHHRRRRRRADLQRAESRSARAGRPTGRNHGQSARIRTAVPSGRSLGARASPGRRQQGLAGASTPTSEQRTSVRAPAQRDRRTRLNRARAAKRYPRSALVTSRTRVKAYRPARRSTGPRGGVRRQARAAAHLRAASIEAARIEWPQSASGSPSAPC